MIPLPLIICLLVIAALIAIIALFMNRAQVGWEDEKGFHFGTHGPGCGCHKIDFIIFQKSGSHLGFIYSAGRVQFKVMANSFREAEKLVSDIDSLKKEAPIKLWQELESNPILFQREA